MYERFTDRARKAMQLANQEAQRFNHDYIGTEHILLGILKEGTGAGAIVLKKNDIELRHVRSEIEKLAPIAPEMITMGKLPQTLQTKKAIEHAMEEARDMEDAFVATEHLLLGLLHVEDSVATNALQTLCGSIKKIRQATIDFLDSPDNEQVDRTSATAKAIGKSKTPALDSFTRDLTELALQQELRPVFGREEEINQLTTVLGRLDRNSAVLVGPGGVGRQSIVTGLAHEIANRTTSETIIECQVAELDQATLISGTKYRGQFEERVKAMVNEIRRAKSVILIVPHIHLLGRLGDFEETGLSMLDVLKHSMSNRYIRCVGVCTPQEFEAHLSEDSDFLKLFQPIHVAPPTAEQTLKILHGIKSKYEEYHRVEIQKEAIQAAVELSEIYIQDLPFPAKAINLIDSAGARIAAKRSPPDTLELDAQIADRDMQKEDAVANKNFDLASKMKDEADKLKAHKEMVRSQWRETQPISESVNVDNVVAALALETGISEQDIRARKQIPEQGR